MHTGRTHVSADGQQVWLRGRTEQKTGRMTVRKLLERWRRGRTTVLSHKLLDRGRGAVAKCKFPGNVIAPTLASAGPKCQPDFGAGVAPLRKKQIELPLSGG